MNTVQKENITQDIDETQKILDDAQNIIEQFNNNPKRKKIALFCVLSIILLCVLLLSFSTIFALINMKNKTIVNGVHIYGIEVSGLTTDEAKEKISQILAEKVNTELILTLNDSSVSILPTSFNVSYDIDETLASSYLIGRTGNIFADNFTILNALYKNLEVSPAMNYDKKALDTVIDDVCSKLPGLTADPQYILNDDNTVTIISGKDGLSVDKNALANIVVKSLYIPNSSNKIKIPAVSTKAKSIDIEALHTGIYKAPTNAYYTANPYVFHPSSTGVDFAISIEEAKTLISTYQDEYVIPLKTLYPDVSSSDIGFEAFPDLLSEFSTSFTSSNYNRSTNISLCAARINGTVVLPGETFSFNGTVGQRTKAAGFKEAPAYVGGQVVQEVGGGICQVSSTLYNAVLYSNLDIVERTNHSFKPAYVKPGLDATVSWGGPDFKFTNNRDYPIKIMTDSTDKILKVYIYGLKTDNDYTVELRADYLSTVYPSTVYRKDSSLATGQTKVIDSGSSGCRTATYKILYDASGNVVSNECISRDTYSAHNKIVAVGP